MAPKRESESVGLHVTEATLREQAFCKTALDDGSFDEMTDNEWVALCEKVASGNKKKKQAEAAAAAVQ